MSSVIDSTIEKNVSVSGKQKLIERFFRSIVKKGTLSLDIQGHCIHIQGGEKGRHAHLRINSLKFLWQTLVKGDIGCGESYRDGYFESNDLTELFKFVLENQEGFSLFKDGIPFGTTLAKLKHKMNRNTKTGSRKNIHDHYDLGNDFFSLWLDKTMTYSSAYYGGDYSLSLADAQHLKYKQIFDQLGVKAGDHVLEIGCGWGGFADYAASQGVKVTAVTISKEQHEYATNRMQKNDFSKLVQIHLKDYRDIEGLYDGVVSIEMIEAVGQEYWPSYFQKISDSLKPGAKAVIQGITVNEADFEEYANGTDFIQQYIFPGGMLIPVSKIEEHSYQAKMMLEKVDLFGNDYAKTLEQWQIDFNAQKEKLEELGFDVPFRKIWNFYLSYCQAGFVKGKINVAHSILRKA